MKPLAPTPASHPPRVAAMNLEDVLFTLFRHKGLILSFVGIGLAAALAVRYLHPPPYLSKAKLMVRFTREARPDAQNPSEQVRQTDTGGAQIINSEVEILTSHDVATNVASVIGPEKILAVAGGGNDLLRAAGMIQSGLTVEIPNRTTILSISFKHPDRRMVQPVLAEVIKAYLRQHGEAHGLGALEVYAAQRREELQHALTETEQELRQLKSRANVILVPETLEHYQREISKYQEELLQAEAELNARQVAMGGARGSGTNLTTAVPPDKLDDYSELTSQLEDLKRRERQLKLEYADLYPPLQDVRRQIHAVSLQRSNLLQQFPALMGYRTSVTGTNGSAMGQLGDAASLEARVLSMRTALSNIEVQASALMDLEPQIEQLERKRNLEVTNINFVTDSQLHALDRESGKVAGINVVQHPTPPLRDMGKFAQVLLGIFGGFVALGLGLAFVLDLVWDRTIRRTIDVDRHLRIPVFLTIPDTGWRPRLPFGLGGRPAAHNGTSNGDGSNGSGTEPSASEAAGEELAAWDSTRHLEEHAEGLRERLMAYFEEHNLNLKKPKLVALTGCTPGAGVSTLASSLAATLSKTGDGNVLLVDMNGDQGKAHSFYKGKPGRGLAEVLEPDNRADAQVQENLFLASIAEAGTNDKLAVALPKKFNHLVPKLKASDYDYIIFDMPPVAPASATPRLANHMDMVLLVLESEKTQQHLAKRATGLLARANVAAVLNKYRHRVPARLSPEP